jgi:hypothetical protein
MSGTSGHVKLSITGKDFLMSRKSSYRAKTAGMICNRLANGESLRSVCRLEGMPSRQTVFNWLREEPEFLGHYERARQEGLKCLADELIDIGDDQKIDVQSRRLMVETRKWILCKLVRGLYGENIPAIPSSPPKQLEDQSNQDNGNLDGAIKAWSDAAAGKPPATQRRLSDDDPPPIVRKRPKDDGQDLGEALEAWKESVGLTAKSRQGEGD